MARWRAVALRAVAFGTVALAASSCGLGTPAEENDFRWEDTGPVLTVSPKWDGIWPASVVVGKLTPRGGCFLIADDVAVFPSDTRWHKPFVEFPSGERVEVGNRVRLGGAMGSGIAGLTLKKNADVPVAAIRECAERAGVETFALATP